MNNKYSWNETLKFSWGHIIAFLAIIFISYVCYMGDFYNNGGDFKAAAIKVLIIDLALLITFIGAQILKGTDSKFDRSIIFERILIVLCPIVFFGAMISYNHFWNVFSERKQIESQFSASIDKSKQMFIDYDNYSVTRINNYELALKKLIENKGVNYYAYNKLGFDGSSDEIRKDNLITTLRLQLQSQNTDSLKTVANQWIDNANQGATIWNAFLVGNVNQIIDAIESWNKSLIGYSSPVLTSETLLDIKVESFADNDAGMVAKRGLGSLTYIYKETRGVQAVSILTSIVLFLMLLFPYFLQKRSTRANGLYFLIPNSKRKEISNRSNENSNSVGQISESKSDDIFTGTF